MLEILLLLLVLGFLWFVVGRIDYQRKMIRVYQVIVDFNLAVIRKKLGIKDKEVIKTLEDTKKHPLIRQKDIESLEKDFRDILNK